MRRNFKLFFRCPEIQGQLIVYAILFVTQTITLVLFTPVIVGAAALSLIADVLNVVVAWLVKPYTMVIEFLENKRSDCINTAHSIIDVDEINSRLNK